MEGAPHESRCYACLTAAPPQLLVDDALPGLCSECRRASRTVRERLARLFPQRLGRNYFNQAQVDPPVLKRRSACGGCGMVGTVFGWTCWRHRRSSQGNAVEGDAFEFCVSCESLNTDPWRSAETPALPGSNFAPHALIGQTLTLNSSFLLVELISLFFISIMVLVLLI